MPGGCANRDATQKLNSIGGVSGFDRRLDVLRDNAALVVAV